MQKKPKEIKIPRKIMQAYLTRVEGRDIDLVEYKKLGSGWHGTGYEMKYRSGKEVKSVILRTLRPGGFSHDFSSDRAHVFLLQNEMASGIPKHIASIDVGGYTPDGGLISIGKASEFFQVVKKAEGIPYFSDLERIKNTGRLDPPDRLKALMLSDYLVDLHSKKFKGGEELLLSMRKRHLRDAVGHGEMLMGVLDTYPEGQGWIKKGEIADIICRAVRFREGIKQNKFLLSRMHGDFHPGNILFKKNGEFELLDASRELWGYAADDVTTLAVNYIWLAVLQTGKFSGAFSELFDLFWNNYMKKTGDMSVPALAPVFFAFRAVVVAHPVFYKDQPNAVRRKMFNFAANILDKKKFDPRRIDMYTKG